MLQWLSSANYGSAVTRLLNAGIERDREDGKDIDAWMVEQVGMGNIARSARVAFERRHGGEKGD